jgi:hypothetical protein
LWRLFDDMDGASAQGLGRVDVLRILVSSWIMSNSSSICQDEANIESNRPFLKQKLEIAAGAYN